MKIIYVVSTVSVHVAKNENNKETGTKLTQKHRKWKAKRRAHTLVVPFSTGHSLISNHQYFFSCSSSPRSLSSSILSVKRSLETKTERKKNSMLTRFLEQISQCTGDIQWSPNYRNYSYKQGSAIILRFEGRDNDERGRKGEGKSEKGLDDNTVS